MQKVDLQQQAVELIKQLSAEKLKSVIDYLNSLQDKEAWEATHELANDPEITKNLEPKPTGKNLTVQRIIEAVEKSHDVTLEDAEALLQVIKENQIGLTYPSDIGTIMPLNPENPVNPDSDKKKITKCVNL